MSNTIIVIQSAEDFQNFINESISIAFKQAMDDYLSDKDIGKEKILTKFETRQYLQISMSKLNGLIDTGRLKAFRIGRQVRIPFKSIEDYIEFRKDVENTK